MIMAFVFGLIMASSSSIYSGERKEGHHIAQAVLAAFRKTLSDKFCTLIAMGSDVPFFLGCSVLA
jgi:hypothetical protein